MHFYIIIKVCSIYFLFFQRASSSQNLMLQNEMFIKDNLNNTLEQFFIDLNEAFIQKYGPQQIVVIGSSANDLQQARPFFERYPYVICKGTERCVLPHRFRRGSFTIVFLENSSEETFLKYIKILSSCKKCKVLFVSTKVIRFDEIRSVFTMTMRHGIPYFKFAHIGENDIEIYCEFITTNCTMEVGLSYVWRPGIHPDKFDTWNFPGDRNGCPISVSSLTFTPKMFIEENKNGSLTVVGGREGKLLLAIASKLNFTIKMRYPSVADRAKYSRKMAIVHDVSSGISEIGIGRLRPFNYEMTTFSYPYDDECITWGVPRVVKWPNNIVWMEFSSEVWGLIVLMFSIGCIVRYIVTSIDSDRKSLGLTRIVLDAVALHLANPVIYQSASTGGRFMLACYLCYVTVITTAYKTSLASILATDVSTPIYVNAQGIIDSNLSVTGSTYDYYILRDQVNDSEVNAKLLDRFVIDNSDTTIWKRLSEYQNWAVLGRRTYLNYHRQEMLKYHQFATFDILNSCVLVYPTVIVLPSKSALRKPVDMTVMRLVESGVLNYWDVPQLDSDKLMMQRSAVNYFEKRATEKFMNIFYLYFYCIAISFVTFLIELLTLILRPYWRKRWNVSN